MICAVKWTAPGADGKHVDDYFTSPAATARPASRRGSAEVSRRSPRSPWAAFAALSRTEKVLSLGMGFFALLGVYAIWFFIFVVLPDGRASSPPSFGEPGYGQRVEACREQAEARESDPYLQALEAERCSGG